MNDKYLTDYKLCLGTIQLRSNLQIIEKELMDKLECTDYVPFIHSKYGIKRINDQYISRKEEKKAKTERKTNKGKKKEETNKKKRNTTGLAGTMNAEIAFDVFNPINNIKYYVSLKRKGCIRVTGLRNQDYSDGIYVLNIFLDYLKRYYPDMECEKTFKWITINYNFQLNRENDLIKDKKINLYKFNELLDEMYSTYAKISIVSLYELIQNFNLLNINNEKDLTNYISMLNFDTQIIVSVNIPKLYQNLKNPDLNEKDVLLCIIKDKMYHYLNNEYKSSKILILFDFYNQYYNDPDELIDSIKNNRSNLYVDKSQSNSKKNKTNYNNIKIDQLECTSDGKFLIKGLKNPSYMIYIHYWINRVVKDNIDKLLA
jgi:hypothetical protein